MGTTYPDVLLGLYAGGDQAAQSLAVQTVTAFRAFINPTLEGAYAAAGGRFVDVTAASGAYIPLDRTTTLLPYGTVPVAVARTCELTYYCAFRDIHARTDGYRLIAELVARTLPRGCGRRRASRHPLVQRRRDLQLVGHRARALRGEVGDRVGEAGGVGAARVVAAGAVDRASTISSATWMRCSRSSSAAAWVSARTPNAPAAHSPRPGIARRDEPPVTCTTVAVAALLEQEARATRSGTRTRRAPASPTSPRSRTAPPRRAGRRRTARSGCRRRARRR